MKYNKKNLAMYILLGMVLGIVVGLLFKVIPKSNFVDVFIIGTICKIVGSGFMNVLKMLVIPVVFISVVCGMTNLSDVKQLGRVGVKTFLLYTVTTALAIILALSASMLLKVGSGLDMSTTLESPVVPPEPIGFAQTVLNIIPTNLFSAFTTGDMLQILFIAIFFGVCMTFIGPKGKAVSEIFESLNSIFIKMVTNVMMIAPLGVFCLMTTAIYNVGLDALLPLVKYFFVFLLVIVLQGSLVYAGFLKLFARIPLKPFFRKYLDMAPLAFSLSSSNALLPTSMANARRLGISKKVYSFTLPLGATINMDGTAIVQAVSVVFLSEIYGLQLTLPVLLTVLLTTLIISIGSPAVPGGSHVTLAVILQSIGLPIEGIALIMGFERLCGMTLTVLNVMGDQMCSLVVAKSEKEFDRESYDDMKQELVLGEVD